MNYKFSLISKYELVGYCMYITGLNADKVVEYNGDKYHKIELADFKICDEYLKTLKDNKLDITEACIINVLDKNGISIGKYNIYVEENANYNYIEEIKKSNKR